MHTTRRAAAQLAREVPAEQALHGAAYSQSSSFAWPSWPPFLLPRPLQRQVPFRVLYKLEEIQHSLRLKAINVQCINQCISSTYETANSCILFQDFTGHLPKSWLAIAGPD